MAVGTITQKLKSFGSSREGQTTMHYTLTCTASSTDGSFPATKLGLPRALRGCRLEAMETNPGSTAPQAVYDITLVDDAGFDLLGGAGLNRSATDTERVIPILSTGVYGSVPVNGDTTVTIANNNVNSAVVVIDLWFSR